jgi:tRNA nucleotidyltransferase/poly(A) polymerase
MPKDIDFAVEAGSFDEMMAGLKFMGLVVKQTRPQFVTVRGLLPSRMLAGSFNFPPTDPGGVVPADYTLCRAETMYTDKRHPDTVTPTTLQDDLKRRDFTMNAVAMDKDGNLVDPFGGVADIRRKLLRTVGNPHDRFTEDPLRVLRAVRFMVTLGFEPQAELEGALNDPAVVDALGTLPVERVREELNRALVHNWRQTMLMLMVMFPRLGDALDRWFDNLWLRATTEER